MPTYNGHKNWNHWNVALWLGSDENAYRMMCAAVKASPTREQAARHVMETLKQGGITHTPDGAPYSVTAIRAAMVDI